ncbi:MAG: hypothetical protein ACI31G_04655 [Bacilli bacterium]
MKKDIKTNFIISDSQKKLLNNYYEVDEENMIATIKLKYHCIEDILDTAIISKTTPVFSREILEKLNYLIDEIPLGYKINIDFYIEDFLNYDIHDILKSFNDSLEKIQISNRKTNRRKHLVAAIFVILGISLLFLMIIGNNKSWFGSEIEGEIISEIIDISAWVFLWEAVTMLFLDINEKNIFSLKMKKRINSIAFINQNNVDEIYRESSLEIFTKWEDEGKLKRLGKGMLLISSAALLCTSFINVINLIRLYTDSYPEKSPLLLTIGTILFLLSIIIQVLAGLGGLFRYTDRKGFLKKFVKTFSIILLLFLITISIITITFGHVSLIIDELFPTIISVFYIIGYFLDSRNNKD